MAISNLLAKLRFMQVTKNRKTTLLPASYRLHHQLVGVIFFSVNMGRLHIY